mmetsp:Transcript_12216/g.45461  ORF Transcript_12216/g.45461 Transcript_12216/m.45461 type:complete len:206 (-) Transcript_12216:2793-3410(-)
MGFVFFWGFRTAGTLGRIFEPVREPYSVVDGGVYQHNQSGDEEIVLHKAKLARECCPDGRAQQRRDDRAEPRLGFGFGTVCPDAAHELPRPVNRRGFPEKLCERFGHFRLIIFSAGRQRAQRCPTRFPRRGEGNRPERRERGDGGDGEATRGAWAGKHRQSCARFVQNNAPRRQLESLRVCTFVRYRVFRNHPLQLGPRVTRRVR